MGMLPKGCELFDNYPAINVNKVKDLPTDWAVQEFDLNDDVLDGWKSVYKDDLNVVKHNNDNTTTVNVYSPIYGCPISISDRWWMNNCVKDPIAFNFVGITKQPSIANSSGTPVIKKYKNLVEHCTNGKLINKKGTVYDGLVKATTEQVKGRRYLTADNVDGMLKATYCRLFIRLI